MVDCSWMQIISAKRARATEMLIAPTFLPHCFEIKFFFAIYASKDGPLVYCCLRETNYGNQICIGFPTSRILHARFFIWCDKSYMMLLAQSFCPCPQILLILKFSMTFVLFAGVSSLIFWLQTVKSWWKSSFVYF